MVTIKLAGSKALRAKLASLPDELRAEVTQTVRATALELRKDVVKSISGEGKGTMYYRIYNAETGFTTIYAGDSEGYITSVKGKLNLSETHRASADGDPPATDTGRLKNSITFDVVDQYTATVGSNLVYAKWLEYGTTQMAARPFFRPAAERIKPLFIAELKKAIRRATQ